MDSRTKNGVRNILSSIPNRILQILLPFIARTVLVKVLGSEYLGLNGLFTSILSVLNLAELGFGSALVYSMYKPIAENDVKKINSLFAVYRKVFIIIGIVVLTAGLCFTPFLPHIIKDDIPKDVNIYLLYIIYLLNTSISYLFFAHRRALITAFQRNDLVTNINSFCLIGLYLTQIFLLLTTRSYYIYIIVLPLFTVIENGLIALQSKRKFPDVTCEGVISQSDKLQIREHVKGLAIQNLCSASRNSFDSIVISMYLGLTSIAIYNNYYYILSSVHALLYQIPNSIRASVGNSIVSESVESNFKKFQVMTLIYQWISSLFLSFLICLYQPFMRVWMGENMLVSFPTVVLFCIYFFELCMSDMIALYKDGAGLWWHGRYRTVIEAISNLVLNFVLGYYLGMNGIIVATIITMTLIGHGYGGYIVFHFYFVGQSYKEYIFLQLRYLFIAIIGAGVSFIMCELIPTNGILDIVVRILICIVIPNALTIPLYKQNRYYNDSIAFIKQMKDSLLHKNRGDSNA